MSTTQNIIVLQYQGNTSDFISIVCTPTDIIDSDYVITVEAYMDGSVMRFRLANTEMYNDLYLGTDFKVENEILKISDPGVHFYRAIFVGNDAPDHIYPAVSVDLTDVNKYPRGTEIALEGWDNSLDPNYGWADIYGLDYPALELSSKFILKRWAIAGQIQDWKVVYADKDSGIPLWLDSVWNSQEYRTALAIALIGHYASHAGLVAAADFSTNKPKYIPYDGSTATTPTYYAYAENDKQRAEIFIYSSYNTSYDGIKPYDGAVPYIPKLISTTVNSADSSIISENMAPAIPNSDGSYSLSGTSFTNTYAIAVIYDKQIS